MRREAEKDTYTKMKGTRMSPSMQDTATRINEYNLVCYYLVSLSKVRQGGLRKAKSAITKVDLDVLSE